MPFGDRVRGWARRLPLSVRLSLLFAVIVTGVATTVAYLEIRALEKNIDGALEASAQLASQSVVDTLAREEELDSLDLRDALHDLLNADPSIDALSVLHVGPAGVEIVASTSTEERAEVVRLARRALATGVAQQRRGDTVVVSVRPAVHRPGYAVAATVGLESLLQARAGGLTTAIELALPTVVILTILVHLIVRRLVGRPVTAILRTMDSASHGDRDARSIVLRQDEFGRIARGLNEMLDRLDGFNRSLQARIDEATSDLSERNAELAAHQSELLTLRESLARAERIAALGQVAATVAHQAGTPLNLVSGYVQMIRDDPATDERTRSRLQTVDRQIQQVIHVLRTFLDRARLSAGLEPVNIAEIVEHVRDVARPRLGRAQIDLHLSIASDLPRVRANVTQLEMALLNLVTNALDAMPGGGTLSIAATRQDRGVRLEISDTGGGIAADVVDRLFDPWVTTKPAGHGSGLGLAIVKDVVRAHGGTVAAVNQAIGALFTIDLPAAPVEGTA